MALTHDDKLAGMYARNSGHDGRYLVAVLSTRIYCLPSCPARKPRAENVRFLPSPAAARRAGFRACRRCRPDDFYAGVDRRLASLAEAVARLRRDPGAVPDVATLAGLADCRPTELTRRVREHYHLTPATLIARARVAHAAGALRSGSPVAAAGYDAGFDSTTAYYRNLRRYLGLSPGEYRTLGERAGAARRGPLEFALRLPGPFDPAPLGQLMGRDVTRASECVEVVRTAAGRRTRVFKAFVLGDRRAVLALTPGPRQAHLRLEPLDGRPLSRAVALEAHAIACRLLGFASETGTLSKRLHPGDALAARIRERPGVRVPCMASSFEALLWAIVGQQVNLAFASALRAALIRLATGTSDHARGLLPHPTPPQVAALDPRALRRRRFSQRKAEWVVALGEAVAGGALDLAALADRPAAEAKAALMGRKGIGEWTAEYVMLRGLGLNDCVPASDAGLTRSLQQALALDARPGAQTVRERLAPYSPCRSLVCQHLWSDLAPRVAVGAPGRHLEELQHEPGN